jgi:hypothetical protein
MRHISIRTLMAFITVCAIGLTALTSTDPHQKVIMMLFTLAALFAGLIGAIVLRGREQSWCLGFSAFWGAYCLLAIVYLAALEILSVE